MNQPQAGRRSSQEIVSPCPVCEHASRRLFRKYDYWIRGCTLCRHRFAELQPDPSHVQKIYGDDYFQGGGAGYPDYLAEAALLKRHGQRYARLLSRYMEPGLMLDVGAAAGFILQGFADSGWRGDGIEPNAGMADFAQTQGLKVAAGTLEESQLPAQHYDLISMIQVVGHFYNLQQAFQTAHRCTKPGGFWLIESWNRDSLTARLLRQQWHEYSPPSVLHWFSPRDLKWLAAQFGFEPVTMGRPAKWVNSAHAKSLLRYKLEDLPLGSALARLLGIIPDNLSIPYPAEDLFWMLFRRR